MDCVRSCRKDSIQEIATPWTPNAHRRRSRRIPWYTVSNAHDRSSIHRRVTSPRSAARSTSVITFSTAVSVEWFFRYVDCSVGSFLRRSKNETSWWHTSFSTTLETKRKVGYWSIVLDVWRVGAWFLQRGLIMAWRWLSAWSAGEHYVFNCCSTE